MHMFLQILDDGRLTDAQGRTVSFTDTLIIMTSNAGTGNVEASVGFSAIQSGTTQSVLGQLKHYFKPEFINRFDGIIEFQPLSKENLLKIVDLMLGDVNDMLSEQHLTLTVSNDAKQELVNLGYNPDMGARPLRRVIQEHVEDQLGAYYLDHPKQHNFMPMWMINNSYMSPKKLLNKLLMLFHFSRERAFSYL